MPMNYGKALLAAFLLLSLSLNSCAKGDPYARKMRSAATYSALTSANHPRLFADDEEFARIREAVLEGGNPMLSRLHERVMQIAESDGQSPDTLVAKLDASNMRLLAVCRLAVTRIFSAAYAYRFTGEERFLRHAEWDINTVCDFKSWNPTHFLDVGEMSTGVALGYDWLYAHLADSTKAKAVRAVEELSFAQARDTSNAWFYRSIHNWNQVCNAGLSCGAIALFEQFPDEARAILAKCLETNPKALDDYSPEGGYPEGYAYWAYGSAYQILLLASLESAFGTDFGLLESCRKGFFNTAEFMQFMSTPSGFAFNFSDSARRAVAQYMQTWMAWKSGNLSLLYPEIKIMEKTRFHAFSEPRLLPFFPIFFSRLAGREIHPPKNNTFSCSGRTPVFIFRSGWESPDDTYLAVKGGLTQSSHSHSDQGSFLFESGGVRWAVDLGMQNYYSIEKLGMDLWDMTQDSERWDIFRIGPFSHNILTVNGHRPKVHHQAELVRTWEERSSSAKSIRKTSPPAGERYGPTERTNSISGIFSKRATAPARSAGRSARPPRPGRSGGKAPSSFRETAKRND